MPLIECSYHLTVADTAVVDRLLLEIVLELQGLTTTNDDVSLTQVGSSSHTLLLQVTRLDRLSGISSTTQHRGIVAVIKRLSSSTAENKEEDAQETSWMEHCDATLLTVLRQSPEKQAALKDTAMGFITSVDSYLFTKDQTFLVGDVCTVADLLVATSMSVFAPNPTLPQNAYRYVNTVLQRIMTLVSHPLAHQLEGHLSRLHEGPPKLTEKPLPAVAAAEPNAILALLQQHGIAFTLYDHVTCHTAEELVAHVPIPATDAHTKNLFLRDKKHGQFLVTLHPSTQVATKDLAALLKLPGKSNLRLADEATLDAVLHVKPGCVGPLCMGLVEAPGSVTLVLDQALLKVHKIHTHPLRNDQSVQLTPTDLLLFLTKIGVDPIVLELATTAPLLLQGKAPANRPPASKQDVKPKGEAKPKPAAAASESSAKKATKKGETLLALQWKKAENFPNWYSDVIVLSEMISYYDISGCYILRPWSYKMWELIQGWFNGQIEELGVENSYFPLFVSQDRLEREKDHVEGFAPEVAWVTKSGSGDLAKPIAVRPTSETIMYPAYSDWIKSHRDLPLKLNQWNNVVRWEFKYPTPFLRTREFLWQEGHTAHSTFEDAEEMVMTILDLYRRVYEELLAVPVVPGYKTEAEKFAGGFRTTTVEAYIAGSGRAIQGATSHHLGQNFGKMFDIKFQDEKGETQVAWQTSWGLTTRTIGVMVMVHGDDQGLVLPPHVAPTQVVIVAIISKKMTLDDARPYCTGILEELKKHGVRAKFDDRTMYNPGWKYNHWEQKGVPLRIEVGPRDMENKSVRIVVRHDGSKEDLPVDGLGASITTKLDAIQMAMFNKAKEARDSHVVKVTEWKDFVPNLEKHNLVLTPWCGGEHEEWEDWVKKTSRVESLKARGEEGEDEKTSTSVAAKTLCIPFDQPELPPGTKCIASGLDAKCWVLWGRSY